MIIAEESLPSLGGKTHHNKWLYFTALSEGRARMEVKGKILESDGGKKEDLGETPRSRRMLVSRWERDANKQGHNEMKKGGGQSLGWLQQKLLDRIGGGGTKLPKTILCSASRKTITQDSQQGEVSIHPGVE